MYSGYGFRVRVKGMLGLRIYGLGFIRVRGFRVELAIWKLPAAAVLTHPGPPYFSDSIAGQSDATRPSYHYSPWTRYK